MALESLVGLAKSDESDTRWWAVRALTEFDDPIAGEIICTALGDSDQAVRHCAAIALRHRPHLAVIKKLASLLDDQDRLLARLAGDALIAIGERATQTLLQTLNDGNQSARIEAVRALAFIKDPKSISDLFSNFGGGSVSIDHWTSAALDNMGLGMRFFAPGNQSE